jgi:hypothetical protein
MIAEGISETVSQKPRRGRPRSVVREVADRHHRMFGSSGCQRTQTNEAYRLRATGRVFDLPDDEQRVLFGSTKAEIWSGKGPGKFPPGWQTAAEEIGRFLVSIEADDDTAADYLRVAVNARRNRVPWRAIRSHFRSLRLGERQGNAVALWIELSRTIDAYIARFPATTKQMIVGAVESLLEVVSEEIAPEPGSPAENDLTICD